MKLKALSLLAALLLVVGLSACSSSDDSSKDDDTTTTEEESSETTEDDSTDTTDEEEDEEADKAEAALDKIESNFGLSKKDPSDETDDTSDETASGLSPEDEECLTDALLDNPDLLEVIDSLDTAPVEDQAAVLDLMFECVDPSVLGVAFAEGILETNPSLSADDALCLGDAFAALPPEIIAELLLLNSDPTYVPSTDAQSAVLGLFTDCGIDPTTL